MITINWEPQPRQLVFLKAVGLSEPFKGGDPFRPSLADVAGYGGAAGGGKTDTLIQTGTIASLKYPNINVGYFRREFPQLEGLGGAILRSLELIPQEIAKYNEQKHRWTFKNNSRIQFNHCKEEKDVYNYQSQQFDILIFDEATQFTEFQLDYLITRNRATIDFPTFKPFTAMGTNPGNIGHAVFKERFIDIGKPETIHEYTYPTGIKKTHIFIPSKLEDNQILETRDPAYRKNLQTTKYNQQVLLEGSWDVFAGQVFRFRALKNGEPYHVIPPQPIPQDVVRFVDIDWGGNAPVAISWKAVLNCSTPEGLQFNRIWMYRELYYGIQGQIPSSEDFKEREGMEFTDRNVAKVIAKYSEGESVDYIVGDPAMKGKKPSSVTASGESIMEAMNDQWDQDDISLFIKPGDNNRVTGLDRVRYWMSEAPDGLPYYQIFDTCKDAIRTYPYLIYKEGEDDVDTDQEDHVYDRDRYGFMSRPYGAPVPRKKESKDTPNTFDYHLKRQRMRRINSGAYA